MPPGPAALHTSKQLQPLSLRPKALAMLVRLAWVPGGLDRDALAEMLFPDAIIPCESLRWQLSQLRARVPFRIEADAAPSPLRRQPMTLGSGEELSASSGNYHDAAGDLCT